ncbi:MAG: ATP-binding cassette domain-containing protein, partial [Pseudomonadota bacterium]|nr:ATP-binding cassette domain-containing protein [Pseudomonadota bacterium]
MLPNLWRSLAIAALGLVVLPFALGAVGLTLTSAIDVVVFAVAAMGLNILVGYTGLVSFGHGTWFGLAAYAAALSQRHWLPGQIVLPALFAIIFVAAASYLVGLLILRRRGVYFSLLTLALTALMFSIAFRWTELTGGENGLGGVVRDRLLGLDVSGPWSYYVVVALVGLSVVYTLARFHRSPVGTVLVAIRENEQRARFQGYSAKNYKLFAFMVSATVTGLAGVLSVFNHRFASADPLSIAFSGELLAMVVIGGMHSFLGPALGAVFFILFREFLSMWTPNWLFWFGLLFVGFIVFSPSGLVGVAGRLLAPLRRRETLEAAMAQRKAAAAAPLPEFLRPSSHVRGPILEVEGIAKSFGGIRAVQDASFTVRDRTLHALIGPNGAGKTTAFNLISGMFPPDKGAVALAGAPIQGLSPAEVCGRGLSRSFQITSLFPGLSVWENLRLSVQARHARRFDPWTEAARIEDVNAETREVVRFLGAEGMEPAEAGSLSYGGQRLVDMGIALASKPRILLLDEPLAGLAAAERERVSNLIKQISADIPVLLVEHDIDRVFGLADHVTVMNDGKVLLDGTVEQARTDPKVREIYIGSGAAAVAARVSPSAAEAERLLTIDRINTLYGKSHILVDVSLDARRGEIVALLGRNGAGKSTLLKTLIGIAPPASGSIRLGGEDIAGLPSAEIARRGVAYVPQGRALFAGMSLRDNLALGRLKRRTGAGTHWDEERIFAFFPRLKERLDQPA